MAFSSLFSPRFKLPIHIAELLIIFGVLGLSGARLLMKDTPPGRSTTMGLGMSAKSLIILLYQLLTAHVDRFRRWGSLKAYWILNALEIVFWAAVAFMTMQGNTKVCVGTSCALGWVIVVLAVLLSILAKMVTVITFLDWRFFKKHGVPRGSPLTKLQDEQSYSNIRLYERE
ncbi:hypothetical protein ACJ41O_015271 [Fusarium nematophilum]